MFKNFLFKNILSRFYRLFLSTNFRYQPLELGEKCLGLTPHADDESIGFGGTLLKYGSKFDVICLTDGLKCGRDERMSGKELLEIRENEFRKAMQKAKVNSFVYTKNIPDKRLILGFEEFAKIDISSYDLIFIPSLFDYHRDHKASSVLLRELLKNKRYKKGLKIVFYEVWSALSIVNCYVDISDVAQEKRDLINIYQSQLRNFDYTEKALALNAYRGLIPQKDYVEAFCVLDVDEFLKYCKVVLYC